MADSTHYVIRGGLEGRERLRVLGRVMRPSTMSLFDRLGLHDGLRCLDVGCGGGDATLEIARRVAPRGSVVGVDLDDVKLQIARDEAEQRGIRNVEFRHVDIRAHTEPATFDFVYARFLLTHLSDPAAAVRTFCDLLRPGRIIAVEDIDFRGHFTYPESTATRRYQELYCASVRRRGADPDIGPRLPSLLAAAGFEDVDMAVAQPAGVKGEAKFINPLTMENIAGAVIADGLAAREEIDSLVRELYAFADDPSTVVSTVRVVQAWGRKPTAASV